MVSGGGSGDVFHIRLNLRQYVGGGGGCCIGRCTVDGDGSICGAEGDDTLLVNLVVTIFCGVSGEEEFFHATLVRSACLSLSQASRSVRKARAARRERVETAVR